MTRKLCAFIVSVLFTVLPCFLAGSLVGLFFSRIFWGCVGYVFVFTLFFMIFDRVPVRLYKGSLKGMRILPLLIYGFTSTDHWPNVTTWNLLGPAWLYRRYYRFKR